MSLPQVTITDPQTGATAAVLVGFGFNCYSYRPVLNGQPHEVLWAAEGFANGQEKPSHSGTPILFPYPGRLRGKSLVYGGKNWPLEGDDGRGNAIHGYVLNRPWRVVEQTGSRVVGEFHASRDDASLLAKWPSDFRIRVAYDVAGGWLGSEIAIDNPGNAPLPFGLGTHAYFRVPLSSSSQAEPCVVNVPVAEYWELVDMLPTGRRLPATGERGLAAGLKFADTRLDDVFTGVTFGSDGWAMASIADPLAGRRLVLRFDRGFGQCVVYNPPHRQAICLEPYTCLPDSYQMHEHGIDTGLRVLQPGESFEAKTVVELKVAD